MSSISFSFFSLLVRSGELHPRTDSAACLKKLLTVKFNSNKSAQIACLYVSGFGEHKCECLDVAFASHTATRDDAMCDDLSPGHIIGTLKRKCVKVAIHYS
jgi:hypothetical protein